MDNTIGYALESFDSKIGVWVIEYEVRDEDFTTNAGHLAARKRLLDVLPRIKRRDVPRPYRIVIRRPCQFMPDIITKQIAWSDDVWAKEAILQPEYK